VATIHACAVLVGARAILIRGPSNAGKSRLALDLIAAPARGALVFSRLVGDDRVNIEARHGRLIVTPAPALAGLLEIRGVGILRVPHEPTAALGWVVDLADVGAERMPQPDETIIDGISLPRLAVAPGRDPFPLVLAILTWGSGSAESRFPPALHKLP
jgi:HPr kinase/phosphorylase